MVAYRNRGHPRADLDHDARALMAEDRREQAFGIGAGAGEFVGVANTGRLDLDQHLAGLGSIELDGGNLERFAGLEGDCGFDVHPDLSYGSLRQRVYTRRGFGITSFRAKTAPPRS